MYYLKLLLAISIGMISFPFILGIIIIIEDILEDYCNIDSISEWMAEHRRFTIINTLEVTITNIIDIVIVILVYELIH